MFETAPEMINEIPNLKFQNRFEFRISDFWVCALYLFCIFEFVNMNMPEIIKIHKT